MADLDRIRTDAVKAQQHDQRHEAWIAQPGRLRLRRHIDLPGSCLSPPSTLDTGHAHTF
jgi:hypothetical protein